MMKKFLQKKGKDRLQIVALLLCTLFCISTIVFQAMAYAVKDAQINPYRPVNFVLYSGFSSTTVSDMEDAIGQWNDAAGVTLLRISSSGHDETFGFPNKEGEDYVYFIDAGTEYVALTVTWTTSGVVIESDINLNSYYSWANGAQKDCLDFYSIFLHETGHTVGLADLKSVSDRAAVMYYLATANSTKRVLTQDDKDGIKEIYGWLTS